MCHVDDSFVQFARYWRHVTMFEQSFIQASSAASTSRRCSAFVAVFLQMLLVAAAVIVPRLYIEALPLHPMVPVSIGRPNPVPAYFYGGRGCGNECISYLSSMLPPHFVPAMP